jgi:hypothetical protein
MLVLVASVICVVLLVTASMILTRGRLKVIPL